MTGDRVLAMWCMGATPAIAATTCHSDLLHGERIEVLDAWCRLSVTRRSRLCPALLVRSRQYRQLGIDIYSAGRRAVFDLWQAVHSDCINTLSIRLEASTGQPDHATCRIEGAGVYKESLSEKGCGVRGPAGELSAHVGKFYTLAPQIYDTNQLPRS
jgi:hypothetical protein